MFNVTINSVNHQLEERVYSYEEIVALAGMTGTPTMAYEWRGAGDHSRSGASRPDQGVEPAEGMHFHVVHTNNA